MISVNNVTKKFINKKNVFIALDDVTIKVKRGQIVGVLGVNGAGKTTLIKTMCGLLSVDNGEIFYDNKLLNKNEKMIKQKINLISGGERNLYWRLTGRDNLQYFASLYNINSKQFVENLSDISKILELESFIDKPIEKCSKGQKQRVQIAKGMINNPDYLFLDEPTLGLDIDIATEFRKYIKNISLNLNKGIVLTTHYIKEAEDLCDYIYVIDKGKIIVEGTPSDIKNVVKDKTVLKITFREINSDLLKLAEQFGGKLTDNILIVKYQNEILRHISAFESNIVDFETVKVSLEDVLLKEFTDK